MTEHDDQTIAHSGSRWEPQPGAPTHETVSMAAAPPVGPPVATPVRPVRRGRRRAALAGAVAALFAVGGVGGLALGNAVGTGDDAPQPGVVQGPDGDDDGDGFHAGTTDDGRPVPPDLQGDDGGAEDDGDGTT